MPETKRISVIVPLPVHTKLTEMARQEKRSLQSQIEWLLERATDSYAPYRPLPDVPDDDEPLTDADLDAIREGREAYARGEYVTNEEMAQRLRR